MPVTHTVAGWTKKPLKAEWQSQQHTNITNEHRETDRHWDTDTYAGGRASPACIPLHAVEAHQHAIANEQCDPHEHVARTHQLVGQEDERNCDTTHSLPFLTLTAMSSRDGVLAAHLWPREPVKEKHLWPSVSSCFRLDIVIFLTEVNPQRKSCCSMIRIIER